MVLSGTPARTPARRTAPALRAARAAVHAAALAPAALLAWRMAGVWRGGDALDPDPVAAVEHFTGLWALRLLLATLAITPLRRLTGWSVLPRFRRMLGLYAFFYASLHLAAYLVLDMGGYWALVFGEIARRPYITVGFLAWLLLVPLALTSTQGWMRRLGRRWGLLHRLVYAIGVLAVLHFWWVVKADVREPALYAAVLTVLLGWRVAARFSRPRTTAAR